MSKEEKKSEEGKTESDKTRIRKTYFFYVEGKGFIQKDFQIGNGERLTADGIKKAEMIQQMFKATQNADVDVFMKVL